jgi:hypothetical protein
MDTRNLVALGMLLALVAFALGKGSIEGRDVKEIVLFLGGGIIGVTLPQRAAASTKAASTPSVLPLILVAGALLFVGCANTSPYVGPPGPPVVDGVERMWPDIYGRLRRETVLTVTNRNAEPLDGVLDCDPDTHHARRWPGSRLTIHVPPRMSYDVLLMPHDHVCYLLPSDGDR